MEEQASVLGGSVWAGIYGDRSELSARVGDLPDKPGVYVFRGQSGEVLYVGKANSLRKRLKSYFTGTLDPKTEALMERVRSLEVITVDSEAEALALECNLIKKHRPKYNIRLKDDKNYPYIRIDLKDQWPKVTVVRRMQQDGARYFGPFTSPSALRETLSLLRRIFPYRSCTDRTLATASRPCLDYHIGRCLGPCTGQVDRDAYLNVIAQVMKFLEGRHREVRRDLEKRMLDAAEKLDFEQAARIRDQIRALDEVSQRQRVVSSDMRNRDVLGMARSGDLAFVTLLTIRQGYLIGREIFILSGTAHEEDGSILKAFMEQHYSKAAYVPDEIVVPCRIPELEALASFLRQRRAEATGLGAGTGSELKVRIARSGYLRDLVAMAEDNARGSMEEYVPKHERELAGNAMAMEELARAIGMDGLPRRIEGYDVSNISGNEAVASMVVLVDGRPDKSSYRRFRMKLQGEPNDFAMMQEALWRRFRRGLAEREKAQSSQGACKFAEFPDLIVVDGGKGQVSAAKEVLDQLGLRIPLIGLAKKNEEVYLPSRPDPLVLPRDSGALLLLMRLRDEAHRFAVTYHRNLRSAAATRSVLLEIPGLGPARARSLLKHFGDVRSIASAPVEDIARVEGIGPVLAQRIAEFLKARDNGSLGQ